MKLAINVRNLSVCWEILSFIIPSLKFWPRLRMQLLVFARCPFFISNPNMYCFEDNFFSCRRKLIYKKTALDWNWKFRLLPFHLFPWVYDYYSDPLGSWKWHMNTYIFMHSNFAWTLRKLWFWAGNDMRVKKWWQNVNFWVTYICKVYSYWRWSAAQSKLKSFIFKHIWRFEPICAAATVADEVSRV